jgi:hypothetical protein
MVFTVGVHNAGEDRRGYAVSRRTALAALGGSALLLVTGCDPIGAGTAAREPDPLEPLLAGTLDLADRYDAAITAAPQLTERLAPIRDDHRAHADALAKLIGAHPSPAPAGTDPSAGPDTDPLPLLREAESAATDAAVTACLAAPAARAGLIGSIAACRATHKAALA